MKDSLLKIINYHGINKQLSELSEQTFQLQEAILLDVGDIECYNDITEKLANVYVTLSQFEEYFEVDQNQLIEAESNKIRKDLQEIENEKVNK